MKPIRNLLLTSACTIFFASMACHGSFSCSSLSSSSNPDNSQGRSPTGKTSKPIKSKSSKPIPPKEAKENTPPPSQPKEVEEIAPAPASSSQPKGPQAKKAPSSTGKSDLCDDNIHTIGEQWKEDCNTCFCNDEGKAVCTRMACEQNNLR